MRNLVCLLLPAKGDVLTPIRILIVGCSTTMRGSARDSQPGARSTMVSPTSTSSMPGDGHELAGRGALGQAVGRFRPSNVVKTLTALLRHRSAFTTPTGRLAETVPLTMRPMPRRPT